MFMGTCQLQKTCSGKILCQLSESSHVLYSFTGVVHIPSLRCELCPKVFKSKSLRSAHTSTHNEERRYQCHLCALRCKSMKYILGLW